MSLILDALRKADSEREREAVPGLNAHPLPSLSVELAPRPRAQAWRWIPLGIVIGALAPLGWMVATRDGPRPADERAVASPSQAAVAPSTAPPAVAAAEMPRARAVPTAEPLATSEPRAEHPFRPQPVAEPAPWPEPDSRRGVGTIKAAPPAGAAGAELRQPMTVAQAPAPAEAPIYSREHLPPEIRAGLPNLVVGGSIYSPSPAARSVIINGRIYRENDALNQELVLEQIKLKAAVLRYKGYRFEIGF